MFRKTWMLLANLLALGLAIAASGGSNAQQAASADKGGGGRVITIGYQSKFASLPIYAAMDHGYFKTHGFSDAKLVNFSSIPLMTTALAQNQVDVAFQTPVLLMTYNAGTSGSKLKFIAPGIRSNLVWTARNGSNVPAGTTTDWKTTVKAFKGKKIGVPALGGIVGRVTDYMAKEAGLIRDTDYSLVATGNETATFTALQTGVVDITGSEPTVGFLAADKKVGYQVLNQLAGIGPPELVTDVAVSAWFSTETRIASDTAFLRSFARVVEDGRRFMTDPARRADVEKLLVKHLDLPPEGATFLYPAVVKSFDQPMSKQVLDNTYAAFIAIGAMPGPAPNYSDIAIDLAIAPGTAKP